MEETSSHDKVRLPVSIDLATDISRQASILRLKDRDNVIPEAVQPQHQFEMGQVVLVRESPTDQWQSATVVGYEDYKPLCRVDAMQFAFTWRFIEAQAPKAQPPAPAQRIGSRQQQQSRVFEVINYQYHPCIFQWCFAK